MPRAFWQRLWAAYWRVFWERERAEEVASVPNPPSEPIAGSERAILIERIAFSYPFSSLLEVGCSVGQNFFTLATLFPSVQFRGVDVDTNRIAEGNRMLEAQGIHNVSLELGDATALTECPDASVDMVVSCAMFLYLDTAQTKQALAEMLRIAKKKVIIMEQHIADELADREQFVVRPGRSDGYWLRNYQAALGELDSGLNVQISKIPQPRWPAERWKELAYLIEIDLG